MHKQVYYDRTYFPVETLESAMEVMRQVLPGDELPLRWRDLRVERGEEMWAFDSLEEFYAEHRKAHGVAFFEVSGKQWEFNLDVREGSGGTKVIVRAPDRPRIERIMAVFDSAASHYRTPLPEPTGTGTAAHLHRPWPQPPVAGPEGSSPRAAWS